MAKIKLSDFNPEGVAGMVVSDEQAERTLFFRSYLTGPRGARYELLREKQHTDEDVKNAKSYLFKNFDVVSIEVLKQKGE